MRPGPGLVVMALAFISGARRGSTNTSSKITQSPTAPPSPAPSSAASPLPPSPLPSSIVAAIHHRRAGGGGGGDDDDARTTSSHHPHSPHEPHPTASILFPSFLGGGGLLTAAAPAPHPAAAGPYASLPLTPPPSLPTTPHRHPQHQHRPPSTPTPTTTTHQGGERAASATAPGVGSDYDYVASAYQSAASGYSGFAFSFGGPPPPLYVLPDHLLADPRSRGDLLASLDSHPQAGSPAAAAASSTTSRAARKRRALRRRRRRRRRRSAAASAAEAKVARRVDRAAGSGDFPPIDDIDNESDSASSGSGSGSRAAVDGLWVQFPSHSPDSSRSIDEDDILALVAEDDFLSEESFDRLTKLADETQKIADDLGEDDYSGGTESAGGSGGDGGGESGGSGTDISIDGSGSGSGSSVDSASEQTTINDGGADDAEPERPQLDDSRSLDEVIENIYAANLVSSGHNEVTALAAATATASESRAASEERRAAAAADARRSIFESLSPLTRLNPWISACDLAQPGGTAPDLQGECSTGTLPVAWVDEGPGPPTCPISCGELSLHNKNNLNNNFNTNSNNNNNNNKFTTSNGNFKATKMRRDVNEREQQQQQQPQQQQQHQEQQHERDEQHEHDMKLTTTKTPAITITKTTASAAGEMVADTTTSPLKATPASVAATTTATATTTKRPSGDSADAEVMLMQQDESGVQHTAAAVASATHHQSHDNNNIVKLRAGYRNGNGNSNNNNNNNNNNHHHDDNNKNDNNYDWKYNEQHGGRMNGGGGGGGSGSSRTRHHSNSDGRQAPPHQCLHYLGDSEQTSPEYLCSMRSPSELVARLRTIRLRHCCERNVFSALHTVALNVTLGGGAPCISILNDTMELDSLASRITCELAEILFRFDCRQVYSLINQCDDCKEAYRRWVCSTLVPYFAEPTDVTLRAGNAPKGQTKQAAKKQREAAPHDAPSAAANSLASSSSSVASSAASDARKQQEIKNLYTGNVSSNNRPQHAAFNYDHKRQKRYISGSGGGGNSSKGGEAGASLPPSLYDIIAQLNRPTQSTRKRRRRCPDGDTDNDFSDEDGEQADEQGDEDGLQPEDGCRRQQSDNNNNNFQTTANSEDPRNTDPVISKLLKRTKRKVEFRKRRRIRPCLSVCQTVERKCPYLLPADRAPALPTQYAGEPTFLCLDQNIPETGEQLRKSGHGPSECCYEFCDNLMDGLCTYCDEFAAYEEADTQSNNNSTAPASGRLHNVTMHPSEPQRFDTRLRLVNDSATNTRFASISIALRNDTADASTALSRATLDRLSYYAHYDGLYYYDDLSDDMPTEAVSEHCPQVPSVSTRCTIPYYAKSAASSSLLAWAGSSTTAAEAERRHLWHSQRLLIWLSALLCLLSSYNAAQCRPAVSRRRRPVCCQHGQEGCAAREASQLATAAIFHLQSNMSKPAPVVALVLEVSAGRRLLGRVAFTRSASRLVGAGQHGRERERERVRSGRERERVREHLQNSRCNDLINFSQIHFSCRSKWKSIYYRSRCNRNFSLSPRPRDSSHLTAYAVTINMITERATSSNKCCISKNNNNMKIVIHHKSGKMIPPPPPKPLTSSSNATVTPKAGAASRLRFVPCDWPHCRIAISNLTYRRYLYFYYLYNFNINDWWRRWGKRKPPSADAAPRTKRRRQHPHKFSPAALLGRRTTWSL